MSTQPIGSGSSVQDLALQIAKQLDANGDGQVSVGEFGTFLENFVRQFVNDKTPGLGPGASAAATQPLTKRALADTAAIGAYRGQMLGFDLSRLESAKDSPKYAFANLAQSLEPTDANMQAIAAQLGASVGHLDEQNNFMLDGDAGGYIGVRDRGNGPVWQWMAYNVAHPGPNGEIT